jgi:hypothetical protein
MEAALTESGMIVDPADVVYEVEKILGAFVSTRKLTTIRRYTTSASAILPQRSNTRSGGKVSTQQDS